MSMDINQNLRNVIFEFLDSGNSESLSVVPDLPDDLPARRLWSVLNNSPMSSELEVLPLLRHMILSGDNVDRIFPVSQNLGLSNIEHWEQHGFTIIRNPTDSLTPMLVQVSSWQPNWLPGRDFISPDAAPARSEMRRLVETVPGDPFLKDFGFDKYRGAGQRLAVRSVLATPPAGTVIINLPTSMGKSLCGHVLGKFGYLDGTGKGVTVVVVPTVALAYDQAQSYASYCSGSTVSDYVYVSGHSGNDSILHRILEGQQEILFTAPESLLGSLKEVLYRAAVNGCLKALVVDEAHIVDSWGDDFRPAFQEIAGLRRALLRTCTEQGYPGFRTILLSATLTDQSVATLKKLFGQPGPCTMVAAVQLRPEPAYWVQRFTHAGNNVGLDSSKDERNQAVLEALRYVPRPVILYVTERDDAYDWLDRLSNLGYRRLDCMTGNTPNAQREKILNRWTANQTDIVVATAAFGLGMDKGDVRTVIHACVPETLDRFYQEVGRGGRDGNACLSLLLYTDVDIQTSKNMSTKRLITTELGRQRWKAMFEAKNVLPDGRYVLNLRTPPGISENRLDMVSDASAEWNARVLTLMQRAGIIELEDSFRHELDFLEADYNKADMKTIRVLNQHHLSKATWDEVVEPHRQTVLDYGSQQFNAMRDVARQCQIAKAKCISTTLRESYFLKEQNAFDVGISCGGCPACRRQQKSPFSNSPEISSWPWVHSNDKIGPELSRMVGQHRGLFIYYDSSDQSIWLRRRLGALINRFVQRQGVSQLIIPPTWKSLMPSVTSSSLPYFVETLPEHSVLSALPTLVFIPPALSHTNSVWTQRHWGTLHRYLVGVVQDDQSNSRLYPPCVVIAPLDTPDPSNPQRLWSTMLSCRQYALEAICTEQGVY